MIWRAYPQYKDSGTEWLGEIPEHWDVDKLKHISSVQLSNVDKNTAEGEAPVRLCNYTDVYYNNFITAALDLMEATATQSEIRKFRLREADVLITKDSEAWDDIAVPAYVTENHDGILCGYHLVQIRPKPGRIDGKYLFRSFCARGINDQFRVAATGITRYGLGKYWIDNGLFPVPPIDEQHAIAAFLDRETARIDALIEKKERQIELLHEKRSALISQAVTKGLNPNVKMKDSGIEWLGEIPGHWEVKRLRFVAEVNPAKTEVSHLAPNTEVSFVPMEAVGEFGGLLLKHTRLIDDVYHGYTYFRERDLVIAKITPCFENCKGSIAEGLTNNVGFGTTELHVVRTRKKLDTRFFFLSLSIPFRQPGGAEMYGAGGQKRVPDSFIRNYPIPLPPLSEQQQIVRHLDAEWMRIDALSKQVQKSIDLLREYRAALISAAVTGKIDVREEAP